MVDRKHRQACLVRRLGWHVITLFFSLFSSLRGFISVPHMVLVFFFFFLALRINMECSTRGTLLSMTFTPPLYGLPFHPTFILALPHLRFLARPLFSFPPPYVPLVLHPTFVLLFTCCRRWHAAAVQRPAWPCYERVIGRRNM